MFQKHNFTQMQHDATATADLERIELIGAKGLLKARDKAQAAVVKPGAAAVAAERALDAFGDKSAPLPGVDRDVWAAELQKYREAFHEWQLAQNVVKDADSKLAKFRPDDLDAVRAKADEAIDVHVDAIAALAPNLFSHLASIRALSRAASLQLPPAGINQDPATQMRMAFERLETVINGARGERRRLMGETYKSLSPEEIAAKSIYSRLPLKPPTPSYYTIMQAESEAGGPAAVRRKAEANIRRGAGL